MLFIVWHTKGMKIMREKLFKRLLIMLNFTLWLAVDREMSERKVLLFWRKETVSPYWDTFSGWQHINGSLICIYGLNKQYSLEINVEGKNNK